ncbi:hypothetical protein E2C01_099686 [Portunus trituberculatus]|uniref:Uncharacterized protein n=1 Tax=Portunus trituberculatus TaxID=210409 RepID=A0A5B7KFJ7_PORTR|nr:hypothetical protein [Portunus trituberculatus]
MKRSTIDIKRKSNNGPVFALGSVGWVRRGSRPEVKRRMKVRTKRIQGVMGGKARSRGWEHCPPGILT